MAPQQRRLILFTRYPVAGRVKTRLIPALGAEGAAALHRRLVLRTLRAGAALCQSHRIQLEVRVADDDEVRMTHWLGDSWTCRRQCSGDLGARMENAFTDSFRERATATVVIGSDCPLLTPKVLAAAFRALETAPVVFGPAVDGGYYLVGLTRTVPELFQGISWGTETVLEQSITRLKPLDMPHALLPPLHDLDRPEDLGLWNELTAMEETHPPAISVIIPALNESAHIQATLRQVSAGVPHEILVVDGGSTDSTATLAQAAGARVIHSKPGRARQMNAGAAQATGNILLFVHADTQLPDRWSRVVAEALSRTRVAAGAFCFRIAEPFPGRWWVERATNFRSRWLGSPYGDQTLFLRRALFEEMGGFANLPIMEDYEFNQRLRKRGRIVTVDAPALTSGRRWRRLGVLRTTLMNKVVIAGYRLGVSPEKLAGWYRGTLTRV